MAVANSRVHTTFAAIFLVNPLVNLHIMLSSLKALTCKPVGTRALGRSFSTFRAVVIDQFLPPPPFSANQLQVKNISCLSPSRDNVVLAVKAAAVNFPDVLMVQGKYQVKPDLPFSPGFEVAGVVEAVGEGVVAFKKGDRVIGFHSHGGFAEQMLVPSNRLLPIPKDMDFAEASALLMAYGTSYYALADKGQLRAGQSVLILGAAGGVGIAAIQIAKTLGARVYAAASSEEKLLVCKAHGADELINYSSTDLKVALKEKFPKGVDVIFDPVGGSLSEAAMRNVAWNGRHLVIGFASGEIPKIPLNLPLLKGCQVIGVFWGDFTRREPGQSVKQIGILTQWVKEGKIKPYVSANYSLEEAHLALNTVAQRLVVGKIVIAP